MLSASRGKRTSAWAGFTLLEALIALALVATGLSAIGAVVATNAQAVPKLERHLDLISIARSVLASLPPDDRLVPGSTSGATATYRWRINVTPFQFAPVAQSPWTPQRVTVQVQGNAGGSFNLGTVRLSRRPTP